MLNKILIIAPHLDDESSRVWRHNFKNINEGHDVYWAICTTVDKDFGWNENKINKRELEIDKIGKLTDLNSF